MSDTWPVALIVGAVAFGLAWLVGRWYGRCEAAHLEWIRTHRPCWYCEGPEGARLRLQRLKDYAYAPYRKERMSITAAPAPGDCDYCRWPPAKLPVATARIPHPPREGEE